jgi:hypothetical protein
MNPAVSSLMGRDSSKEAPLPSDEGPVTVVPSPFTTEASIPPGLPVDLNTGVNAEPAKKEFRGWSEDANCSFIIVTVSAVAMSNFGGEEMTQFHQKKHPETATAADRVQKKRWEFCFSLSEEASRQRKISRMAADLFKGTQPHPLCRALMNMPLGSISIHHKHLVESTYGPFENERIAAANTIRAWWLSVLKRKQHTSHAGALPEHVFFSFEFKTN